GSRKRSHPQRPTECRSSRQPRPSPETHRNRHENGRENVLAAEERGGTRISKGKRNSVFGVGFIRVHPRSSAFIRGHSAALKVGRTPSSTLTLDGVLEKFAELLRCEAGILNDSAHRKRVHG